jgi:uncharacterized membrane protein YcaP (DUF421 family)
MEEIRSLLGIGADPKTLTLLQMAVRVIVIYGAGLAIVRTIGDKRFSGKYSPFDIILSITFGSLLSRAINGSAPFWVTVGAGAILVGIHWIITAITCRSNRISRLLTGKPLVLVQEGKVQSKNLLKAHISQRDLVESLRLKGQPHSLSQVQEAYLERDGRISIIPAPPQPQVLEIKVEDGVQTVCIRLE